MIIKYDIPKTAKQTSKDIKGKINKSFQVIF